jgi:hypothetical protein
MTEGYNLDNTEDLEVNTTHRHTVYCHKVSEDGTKKCSLYSPHEGLCLPKHGVESDRFIGIWPGTTPNTSKAILISE